MLNKFTFISEDKRVRRDILPQKIICCGGEVVGQASLLEKKDFLTITNVSVPNTVLKNGDKGENAFFVLDFGCEFHGSIRIISVRLKGKSKYARVRITFGESLTEALSDLGEKGATNDHSPRDFVCNIVQLSDLEYGMGGFRFVKVELLSPDCELQLHSITGVFIYSDLEYKGSFKCSDETLNRIYDVAAYTAHLNIQRYVWDGIKRDRLVWGGDINPELKAIRTIFGRCDELEKTINYFGKSTPAGSWVNGIPTYTLWWLISVYEWYFCTGNKEFLKSQRNCVIETVKQILLFIDDDGSINRFPGQFLDHATNELEETVHSIRGLFCEALKAASELCSLYKEKEISDECLEKIPLIQKREGDSNKIKAIAAFMYNAGIPDKYDVGQTLTNDGAKGLSTFMSYYIFKAMSESGHHKEAIAILKDYYGAMLNLGATTFWEDFNIEWAKNAVRIDEMPDNSRKNIHSDFGGYCYKGLRHSLCHGWSAGPVPFLNDYVLGIKILEPGCKSVEIKGDLGDLDWAEGTFPTPFGTIYVRHQKQDDGSLKTVINAPEQILIKCENN